MTGRILRCILGVANLAIVAWLFVPSMVRPRTEDGMLERGLDLGGTALLTLTAALHLLRAGGRRPHRGLTIGMALVNLLLAVLIGCASFYYFFAAMWDIVAIPAGIMSVLALNGFALFAARNAGFDTAGTSTGGD